ncbi:PDZ domain-containing protein 8 [Cloeon dipterum]|uniref:PDZ domain-containing protein 8 n=1 Tax=Cloeon dipterum TaxID=197152 RepID=UPI0032204AD2
MMNLDLVWLIVLSVFFGAFIAVAALLFALHYYLKPKSNQTLSSEYALETPNFEQFQLPQSLLQIINTTESPKKETCVALNLLFHFLYYELRNSEEVRLWFLKKLTLEFDELLTRTTTGKFIDKISIKEIDLGSKFPIFNGISIQDVVLHPTKKYIETLDLSVDLHYEGGFQLVTSVRLILGAPAKITVKVCHLSGRARLRFTRQPFSHWSFTFYNEPSLELQVDSHFQGRPVPQVTSLIVSQIRKAVKKKHTVPQFKMRYKPFFQAPLQTSPSFYDQFDQSDVAKIPPGVLKVSLIECTRLNSELVAGDVYCTLAVDEAPWTELVLSDSSAVMTLDLIVFRKPSQNLGVTFKTEQQVLVAVDTVERNSPGYFSKLKKGDILLSVQGTKVVSLSQASKLLRAAPRRFPIRIERRRSRKLDIETAKEVDENGEKSVKLSPHSSPIGVRRRLTLTEPDPVGSVETESSGSSTASPSSSPIKKPAAAMKNLQLPEEVPVVEGRRLSSQSAPAIQIYRTKELTFSSDLNFNESVTFQIGDNVKYFNFGVWSAHSGSSDGKDVLMGHLSIPLHKIIDKCTITGLGHLIKKWQLLEPCVSQSPHTLTDHSGFDPSFCFGDALFCFILLQDAQSEKYKPSSARTSFSGRGDADSGLNETPTSTPAGKESPAHETSTPNISLLGGSDESTSHDFVRTHFSRTTLCDFCCKKIWLKDAVQCRSCKMTCHKKCVVKCQATAVCVPIEEDQCLLQGMSPTKTPEIVTTEVEGGEGVTIEAPTTPQSSKRGLGGLLASVANAAQSRSIKRAGSASSLAPPNGANSTPTAQSGNTTPSLSLSFSRSLPHSPQVSPSSSRKASIADPALLFELPTGLAALDDSVDEILIEEAMEQLLQRSFDNEEAMSLAKDTGKQLYSGQSGRKEKINKLISKLKISMDREMQIQEAVQAEPEDESEKISREILLNRSEKRVQAITVLMLHCCSGLQHVQDTEDDELGTQRVATDETNAATNNTAG